MTSDAAQLDAIAAAILAGAWSPAVRRQLQAKWSASDIQMDDWEGRIRRSLKMQVTTPADKEQMRWQLFDQYEEARLLAIQIDQPAAACTAIKGKVELLGLAVQKDGKGAPVETGDAKSDRDVWLNALAQCPAEILEEFRKQQREERH